MNNNLPDDSLPPLPPSDDHGHAAPPLTPSSSNLSSANLPPTPPLSQPQPMPTISPSIDKPLPNPTNSMSTSVPTNGSSSFNQSKSEEPIIGAPKQDDIPTEAPFPGQPVPEAEQEKLEKKAEEIVGETSALKDKKSKRLLQVVVGVFALMIVGAGVLVGTNMVQLPGVGDVRQQAISGGSSLPCNGRAKSSCNGCLEDGKTSCVWRNGACKEKYNAGGCSGPIVIPPATPPPNCAGYWCADCGGFCGWDGIRAGKTCNQQAQERGCLTVGATCPNPANGVNIYYCKGKFDTSGGCQSKDPLPAGVNYQYNGGSGCTISGKWCGLIQVDEVGSSPLKFLSKTNNEGCDTSTPPPQESLACTGMTSVPANPKLGDSVRYTCSGTTSPGAIHHYGFQYKVGSGAFTNLAATAVGSAQSAPLTISEPGTYTVRCRACKSTDDSNCTAWQSL